jgi:hypothetical protein
MKAWLCFSTKKLTIQIPVLFGAPPEKEQDNYIELEALAFFMDQVFEST